MVVTLPNQNFDSAAHIGLQLSPRKCFTVQAKFVSQILHNKSEVSSLWAETKLSSWAGFLCLLLKSGNPRICDGIMSLGFALGNKGHVGAVSDVMFWRLKIQHPISLDACCTSCYPTAPISSGPRLSICMHFVPGIFITKQWNNIPLLQTACSSIQLQIMICSENMEKAQPKSLYQIWD